MKMKLKKFRTVAGIGLAALTLAACGSSQGAQVLTVPTTTAPNHYPDGMYVGNYTGQYAKDIVTAKKFLNLEGTLLFEVLNKQKPSAIAQTVKQMSQYAAQKEIAFVQKGLKPFRTSGDTAKLVKGTIINNSGTDKAPITVTASTYHGQLAVLVNACGYSDIEVDGPNGKPITPNGPAGDSQNQSTIVNGLVVYVTSNLVVKCPAN